MAYQVGNIVELRKYNQEFLPWSACRSKCKILLALIYEYEHACTCDFAVLNCNWRPDARPAPIGELAAGLDLRRDARRPWAVFDVNILGHKSIEKTNQLQFLLEKWLQIPF